MSGSPSDDGIENGGLPTGPGLGLVLQKQDRFSQIPPSSKSESVCFELAPQSYASSM